MSDVWSPKKIQFYYPQGIRQGILERKNAVEINFRFFSWRILITSIGDSKI